MLHEISHGSTKFCLGPRKFGTRLKNLILQNLEETRSITREDPEDHGISMCLKSLQGEY